MSWHYLQGQEVGYWGVCSLDGAPSALLSLIHMQGKCCLQDKQMDVLEDSQSGMMLPLLMEPCGQEKLMSLQVASHAKISVQQGKELELQVQEVGYGSIWQELFMKCDLNTSLLRTHHCLWEEDLPLCSVILPQWGLMQDGVFWELTTVMLTTYERDAGFWPTPLKEEGPGGKHMKLTDAIAIAAGYKPRYYKLDGMENRKVFTGKVNPEWAEWLMGWPLGWTNVLQELGMGKFQQWLDLHGKH